MLLLSSSLLFLPGHQSNASRAIGSFVTHDPLRADGKPGYNTDLILMDLEKLRASATYKSYFSEIRLNKLIKNYFYHSMDEVSRRTKKPATHLVPKIMALVHMLF